MPRRLKDPWPGWVRYSPAPALLEGGKVSPRAELAHRRLCDFHWTSGQWPAAAGPEARGMARCPPARWPDVLAELRAVGWARERGRLVNRQAAAMLAEAARFLSAKRRAGSAGGQRSAAGRPADDTAQAALKHCSTPAPSTARPSTDVTDVTDATDDKPVPSKALLNAERSTRSAGSLKQASRSEREFFDHLTQCLELWKKGSAARELANWGGWWRNRHREDADKARRVLAEVLSLVREKRVTLSPGAAAVDLWQRLP